MWTPSAGVSQGGSGFVQVTFGTTLPLMVHQISALRQYFWPLNAGHTISPLAFNPAHQDAAWPCMGQHLSLCRGERQGDFWYAGISDLEPDASFRARGGRYEMYGFADKDRCLHSHRLYNYSCLRRLPASFPFALLSAACMFSFHKWTLLFVSHPSRNSYTCTV